MIEKLFFAFVKTIYSIIVAIALDLLIGFFMLICIFILAVLEQQFFSFQVSDSIMNFYFSRNTQVVMYIILVVFIYLFSTNRHFEKHGNNPKRKEILFKNNNI